MGYCQAIYWAGSCRCHVGATTHYRAAGREIRVMFPLEGIFAVCRTGQYCFVGAGRSRLRINIGPGISGTQRPKQPPQRPKQPPPAH
ncbi:hypothetical protein XELAEV_18046532mg [Xenopus laevis]|uniref:Uncharacterized protein n=1 Tax=Xenopus laevis TaxID=8355 RepID=A0A974BT52_XENLA|nr:hypothetical protein XELAEV_18046532mg [Xenopus laevis]